MLTESQAVPQLPPPVEPKTEKKGGWTIQRIVTVAVIGFAALILLPFVIGLIIAVVSDVGQFGELVRVLRDIALIVLAMVGIIIAIALAVLILQVAQLITLLQTDVKPILDSLQSTLRTTQDTVRFVGENVARPAIKASGFMAGLMVFLSQLGGIRRAIKPKRRKDEA
jgi:predicted PurR-regulated permease PerM